LKVLVHAFPGNRTHDLGVAICSTACVCVCKTIWKTLPNTQNNKLMQ